MLGHMIWRSHVTRAMSVLWVISGTSYYNSTENNKNDNNNGNDKNNNNNSNNNNWNYYYHYRCCFVVVVFVIVAAVEFGSLILLVTLDCFSKCILYICILILIPGFDPRNFGLESMFEIWRIEFPGFCFRNSFCKSTSPFIFESYVCKEFFKTHFGKTSWTFNFYIYFQKIVLRFSLR